MATTDFALKCSVCSEFLDEMKRINESTWLPATKTKMMSDAVDAQLQHEKQKHYKKLKTFAFTFTTNQDTQLEIQKEMIQSAWKLFLQKTTPVEEGAVYLEYTEMGRPHLHGWYRTENGGRIFAKTFKRCWPFWGEKDRQQRFPGGYHEEMKDNRYKEYASSEGRLVISKVPGELPEYKIENAETYWIQNSPVGV